MFHLMLNRFSWQCLNISLDVSTDPSLKWCSSNWAALIPFGWLLNQGWLPGETLLIPLPNASTTPTSSSSSTKLHHIWRCVKLRKKMNIFRICTGLFWLVISNANIFTTPCQPSVSNHTLKEQTSLDKLIFPEEPLSCYSITINAKLESENEQESNHANF